MKQPNRFVFSLSEWSLARRPKVWLEHTAIMLNSLRANTPLQAGLAWRGDMAHPFVRTLQAEGVEVRESRRPFDHCFAGVTIEPAHYAEVCLSTLLKVEAATLFEDETLFVGDLDTLWLSPLPAMPDGGKAIMARLGNHVPGKPAGTCVSSPLMLVHRARLLAEWPTVLEVAARELPKLPKDQDEHIFTYGVSAAPMPAYWRNTFSSAPANPPHVVHFMGPKCQQVRDLCDRVPDRRTPTIRLFLEHRERLVEWCKIAEGYANRPRPLYDALSAAVYGSALDKLPTF